MPSLKNLFTVADSLFTKATTICELEAVAPLSTTDVYKRQTSYVAKLKNLYFLNKDFFVIVVKYQEYG